MMMDFKSIILLFIVSCSVVYAKKDYYKVLDVDRSASQKDIKKAFRNLALKYHPDKNPDEDTSRKFREIAEAYEVLRDEEKRRQYDQMGHGAWGSSGGGYKPGNFNFDDLFKDFDDDFFKDLRGHFEKNPYSYGSSNGIKMEVKNGQKCRTVTQKVGNSVTTFTQCSN